MASSLPSIVSGSKIPASKEGAVPTYISLIQYTQQGMQKIKESPARLE
jgi:uncharacterized protein with GYD domain